jgi:Holliday junction DNA helicase RuvA
MIASISGTIKSIHPQSLVIEVGGVGLLVNVSSRISAAQLVGTSISLHTVLVVREDALTLFGFESSSSRDLFELLQTVTGIGPKVAQSALGLYSAPELVSAIKTENLTLLEKIPGLGKKGAARVALELKEKIAAFDPGEVIAIGEWRTQLTSALLGLGYSAREAQERIDRVASEFKEVAQEPLSHLLRSALSGINGA